MAGSGLEGVRNCGMSYRLAKVVGLLIARFNKVAIKLSYNTFVQLMQREQRKNLN